MNRLRTKVLGIILGNITKGLRWLYVNVTKSLLIACLSLGQEEEMGVLVGIGFYIRINPTHTKYKNSCLYHYI